MATSVTRKSAKKLLLFLAGRSYPTLHRLARFLYLCAWYGNSRIRKVVATNLALCFPQLCPEKREQLCRQAVHETLMTGMEMPRLWLHDSLEESLYAGIDGQELIQQAMGSGKGVIMITPHLGNWEYLILKMAALYPCSVLCNNTDDIVPMQMNEIIQSGRMKTGATMVEAKQGVKVLVEALQRGEIVMIAPDQIPPKAKGRQFADFFGQPTATMTLVPRLANITQAQVLAGFAKREPDGRYHLLVKKVDNMAAMHAGNLPEALLAMNQAIEQLIAEAPAQYLWTYKRFRLGPQGKRNVYS